MACALCRGTGLALSTCCGRVPESAEGQAGSISGAHRAICGAQQSYCTAYPLALENIRPLLPGSLVIQQQLCPVEGCGASSFIGRTRTRPNGPARLRTCARVTP